MGLGLPEEKDQKGAKSLDEKLEQVMLPLFWKSERNAERADFYAFSTFRKVFKQKIENGKKPIIAVLLVESLRAVDLGIFGNTVSKTITPALDELARDGIYFKNSYSTGTVTRGAQEAVFCGHLSAQNTAVMRPRNDVKIVCLPELVHAAKSEKKDVGETFWFHGGEGRFDSQESFWRLRQVDYIVSQKDFPREAAATGWGIGDFSFLENVVERLKTISLNTKASYLLGLILTISHHIPWDLPADIPIEKLPENDLKNLHSSFSTLAYSDFAIGHFVALLKEKGLWDNAMIIISGDHGTQLPICHGKDESSSQEKLVHVPLILTGGLVDEVLQGKVTDKYIKNSRDEFVSQVDIEAFIGEILGLENRKSFGEALFAEKRKAPVVSDLGEAIYFPEVGVAIDYKDLKKLSDDSGGELMSFRKLYYLGFLNLLDQWGRPSTTSRKN